GVVCPSPGTRYMTTMILVTVNGSAGGICVMAIVLFHGLGLVQVLLSVRLGHFLGRRRVGVVLHRNLLPGLGPACWCSCRLGEARPARAAGWGWPAGGLLGRPVLISGFRIVRLCRPASSFVSASACAFAP